jgi:tetratricopeptide (TPR) repeat protein
MYRLELGSAWRDLFRASAQQYSQTVAAGTPDTGALDQALGNYERAVQAYEDAIAYVPQEYDTYVFLASLHNEAATYLGSGVYAERAVEVARRGVAVERYGPAVRVQLATGLMLLNQTSESIRQLEFATALDSNYLQAFVALADAYRQAGRIEDAKRALTHVVERSPGDVNAQAGLAALEASSATATGQ